MSKGQIGAGLSLAMAVLTGACSERSVGAMFAPNQNKEPVVMQNADEGEQPVRQLPFAHGRNFATLDDYLAHLRDRAGPVGQPWYRKVGTDTYELVTTRMPPDEPQIFSREELMRRFGFSR